MRVTAVYPNGEGSRFDADYYVRRHRPLAERLLTPHGLTGIRIALGVSAMDGAPPPYWAISEMIFASPEAFAAAMELCGDALFADAENYTDVTPVLQISRTSEPTA
jgi:uncharacterized protein (TIGR02118 family)